MLVDATYATSFGFRNGIGDVSYAFQHGNVARNEHWKQELLKAPDTPKLDACVKDSVFVRRGSDL